MTELPTVDTIIEDIEFELLLGMAPAGEVRQALVEIRREQNRIRSEYARKRGKVNARDAAGVLMRVNDMLLDVLHEIASRLVRVESVVEQAARRLPAVPVGDGQTEGEAQAAHGGMYVAQANSPGAPNLSPRVELNVQPVPVPIAGRLIDRLRVALHQVPVYYVRHLAEQQAAVNVYEAGLVAHLNQIVSEQQRQLDALEQEVIRLRALASNTHTEEGSGLEKG